MNIQNGIAPAGAGVPLTEAVAFPAPAAVVVSSPRSLASFAEQIIQTALENVDATKTGLVALKDKALTCLSGDWIPGCNPSVLANSINLCTLRKNNPPVFRALIDVVTGESLAVALCKIENKTGLLGEVAAGYSTHEMHKIFNTFRKIMSKFKTPSQFASLASLTHKVMGDNGSVTTMTLVDKCSLMHSDIVLKLIEGLRTKPEALAVPDCTGLSSRILSKGRRFEVINSKLCESWVQKPELFTTRAAGTTMPLPLFAAIYKNQNELAEKMIDAMKKMPEKMAIQESAYPAGKPKTKEGWTALHLAIHKNNTKIAKQLIHAWKTLPNLLALKGPDGVTPLFLSICKNNTEIAVLLIESLKNNPDLLALQTTKGKTALQRALSQQNGVVSKMLIDLLKSAGELVKQKHGVSALISGIATGYTEGSLQLIDALSSTPDVIVKQSKSAESSLLALAMLMGVDQRIILKLVEVMRKTPEHLTVSVFGKTYLEWAEENENKELVSLLKEILAKKDDVIK